MCQFGIVVRGTRSMRIARILYKSSDWNAAGSDFRRALEGDPIYVDRFPDGRALPPFSWSGRNAHSERLAAAEALASFVLNLRESTTGKFFLVGHSHGGNVALEAADRLPPGSLSQIFMLATPHFRLPGSEQAWVYGSGGLHGADGPFYNIYSPHDLVQYPLARFAHGLPRSVLRSGKRFEVRRSRESQSWVNLSFAAADGKRGFHSHAALHSRQIAEVIRKLVLKPKGKDPEEVLGAPFVLRDDGHPLTD